VQLSHFLRPKEECTAFQYFKANQEAKSKINHIFIANFALADGRPVYSFPEREPILEHLQQRSYAWLTTKPMADTMMDVAVRMSPIEIVEYKITMCPRRRNNHA